MSPVAVRRGCSQTIDIAPVAARRRGSVAVRRGYSQVFEIPTVAVAVAVCGPNPPYPPIHPAPRLRREREVLTGLAGKKKENAGRLRPAAEGGTLVVGSGLRPAAFGGVWYRVVRV